MKTYQVNNKPKDLFFSNYDRVDESILFQQVLEKLENNQNVQIGAKKELPSEDLYECKIGDSAFWLIYDIDYGTSIQVEDIETISKLKNILE